MIREGFSTKTKGTVSIVITAKKLLCSGLMMVMILNEGLEFFMVPKKWAGSTQSMENSF